MQFLNDLRLIPVPLLGTDGVYGNTSHDLIAHAQDMGNADGPFKQHPLGRGIPLSLIHISFNCCKQKKLNGCWECPAFPCDNPMLNKPRVRTFAAFVLEHGEAALIRALQKNEADGVLYHYPGRLVGDYDLPESGSAIRAMLLRGLEAAQDAHS